MKINKIKAVKAIKVIAIILGILAINYPVISYQIDNYKSDLINQGREEGVREGIVQVSNAITSNLLNYGRVPWIIYLNDNSTATITLVPLQTQTEE